jgi:hypothetical protein
MAQSVPFFPRLPRMAIWARRNRCLLREDDVKSRFRRPREGTSPGYRLQRSVSVACVVPHTGPSCPEISGPGSGWAQTVEFADENTPNGARHRVLPAAQAATYLGTETCPGRSSLPGAKGSGTCMVKPRGGTARVNGELCLVGVEDHATTSSVDKTGLPGDHPCSNIQSTRIQA